MMGTTLLKTTRWMILAYHRKIDGTHGRTTFEDDPEQQLLRGAAHGKLAQWWCKMEQNENAGNDSGNWGKTQW